MEDKTVNLDTVEMTVDLKEVQRVGGEAGTSDYNDLANKPQINNVELAGNKTLEELGIQPQGNYVSDANYVHTDNNFSNEDKNKLDGLSNYELPKASDTVLGGIKIGDNLSIDDDGKVNASVVAGENGATFTPSVSEEGIISWTNDKDLENPSPVNIKGPKGDKGEQGEPGPAGQDGANGQGVPAGGTTGQVLSKNSDSNYDTSWISLSQGGSSITELTGTEENPINLTTLVNPGLYILKGYITDNYDSVFKSFKIGEDAENSILCFVGKSSRELVIKMMALMQYIFVGNRLFSRYAGTTASKFNSEFTRFSLKYTTNFTDSAEETASNYTIQNAFSNYLVSNFSQNKNNHTLSNLNTTDKTSLVAAINELKAEIDEIKGGV